MYHVFNKTREADMEESGNVVPYRVELADAESQLR